MNHIPYSCSEDVCLRRVVME